VGSLLKTHKVFVATSDKLQQEIIWSKGAYRVSSRELLTELERTQKEYREVMERKSTGKRNYLESNLNKDVLEKLEKLRRKKH
jgi:predicted RNA-binding protein with PIN domain